MPKRVLDVGNCNFDHSSIRQLIENHFDAEVLRAHTAEEALESVRREDVDLVLVNRLFDENGDDGLQLIRTLKSDPQLQPVSVMLLSNYANFQEEAQTAGAEPGFGKAELTAESTVQRLSRVLSE